MGNLSAFPTGIQPEHAISFNMSTPSAMGFPRVEVWARNSTVTAHLSCNLETRHVHIHVKCDATACVVDKTEPRGNLTAATVFTNETFAQYFFDNLLISTSVSTSLTDLPLVEFNLQLDLLGFDDGVSYVYGDGPSDMTFLINTYMQASQITNPLFPSWNSSNSQFDTWFVNATGKGAISNPGFVLSRAWIAVDLITCGILFIAALAAFWLRINTMAPDIFGYVSSMTRDNPHMMLPQGGSTMSGPQRARALRNVKVKVADVSGMHGNGIGHIGLVVVRPDIEMGRLERQKRYL